MWKEQINDLLCQSRQQLRDFFHRADRGRLYKQLNLPVSIIQLDDGREAKVNLSAGKWLDQMVALEEEAYHGVLSWKREDFLLDMLYRPDTFYLQLALDGQLIAFIGCRRDPASLHVSNFIVAAPYRSRGLGRELFNLVTELLPQIDRSQIVLEVKVSNERAIRFYQSLGFSLRRYKENYYQENQETALELVWDWNREN